MNAIQTMLRVEFYNDTTRSARFFYSDINKAVNDAIELFTTKTLGIDADGNPQTFQLTQGIRDELYTLIKTATPAITAGTAITTRVGAYTPNHVNYPTDYRNLVELAVLIDGYSSYSRPTNYNEIGPMLENVFLKPSNQKTYYNEDSTGFTIWRGTGGTFSSATLTYIKTPNTFSCGNESLLINAGTSISNGAVYIAVNDSVHAGVTYIAGTQFTSSSTVLTSGTVILASNTTPIELPEKTHDEIAKIASGILLGITSDYPKSQFVERESQKG
jgi:hypothetical protein